MENQYEKMGFQVFEQKLSQEFQATCQRVKDNVSEMGLAQRKDAAGMMEPIEARWDMYQA